jgi:CSLREA domain-containing protein
MFRFTREERDTMDHVTHEYSRRNTLSFGIMAALVVALTLTLTPAPVAHAAAIAVTTTADELNTDGDCSLREAIKAANSDSAVDACAAGSGADTITLPAGVYTLTLQGTGEDIAATGDLDITGALTITGADAASTIVESGNQNDRVFEILGATATLSQLTIRNGNSAEGGAIRNTGTLTIANSIVRDSGNRGGNGGGIYNAGTLTLSNSTISSNLADTLGGYDTNGGGIYNAGTLTLLNSTVSNNLAGYRFVSKASYGRGRGAGIYNGGTATLSNSTVSGNTANSSGDGGGIYNAGILTLSNSTVSGNEAVRGRPLSSSDDGGAGGGIYNVSTATLSNSTISSNKASGRGGGVGGGIYNSVTLSFRNTLLARNIQTTPIPNSVQASDCLGTLISQGYNLVEKVTCSIVGDSTGNLLNVNARLDLLLQDNGGPTLTQGLLPGSPAIDAGNPAAPGSGGTACEATDQRGVVRPEDGNGDSTARCDIGAYERRSDDTLVRREVYLPLVLNNR